MLQAGFTSLPIHDRHVPTNVLKCWFPKFSHKWQKGFPRARDLLTIQENVRMKNLAIQQSLREMSLLLISASLLLTVACSPSGDETAQTETVSTGKTSAETAPPEAEAVQSVGIPITTESDPARAIYAEGQYFIDVGRGVQAREIFMAAIAEDPAFALAYYGQSNAALSFAEFQRSLDSATQHSEGISDGEQMMININRSFLSNDSAAGLAIARELVGKYPDSVRAWIILAGMQANENDNEGARVSNKKALALEENSAAALAGLAINNLFGEPRDFVAAERWASQFIAAYPGEAKGHEVLGDIKRAQNDLEAALEAYNVDLHLILPRLCMQEMPHPNVVQGNIVKQSDRRSRGNLACKSGVVLVQISMQIHSEYPDGPFMFVTERGGPLTRSTVNKLIERAGRNAEIEFPVHPHMLRHACGYYLANKGIDTRTIQDFLGHVSITHTVRYTELAPHKFKGLWS